MPRGTTSKLWALVFVLAVVAGCGGDPAGPGDDSAAWTTVDLSAPQGNLGLMAVAAVGSHVASVGWFGDFRSAKVEGESGSILFELQSDGTWLSVYPAPGLASNTWLDLALDPEGRLVLAGYTTQGVVPAGGRVLDMRAGSQSQHGFPSLGLLSVDGDEGVFVAGGASNGGELWTSRGVNQWVVDDLPLTGTNDSGFPDVDVLGDKMAACGYDDGSDDLAVILQRDGEGPWTHVPLSQPMFFGRTLQAVALTSEGAIFVGGIQGAGGLHPLAFFSVRSASGEWTDIDLPNPEILGGVNDILIAADGTKYLACSGEGENATAQIVHATGTGVDTEITAFTGQLRQLAQTGDGTLYAVGYKFEQGSGVRPVMLRRGP